MSIKLPDLVQNLIDYYIWKSKHNKVMEDYHRTIKLKRHSNIISDGIYAVSLNYNGVWAYNIYDKYAKTGKIHHISKLYHTKPITIMEVGKNSSILPIPTLKNMEIPYITKHGIVSRNLMKYLEERSMEERSMEERSNKLTNYVRTN
jgi:hypothetical protein